MAPDHVYKETIEEAILAEPLRLSSGIVSTAREQSVETVPADEFRRVLGHLPTGVTVLTSFSPQGPVGMAANSVTSVSLAPPLILICPARTSTTWPSLRSAQRFCVNVLADHDTASCRRFASRTIDRFAGVNWHERPGGPALDDAVAWIDCELEHEYPAGDHTIALASVIALDAAPEARPLVFFRGTYGGFGPGPGSGR